MKNMAFYVFISHERRKLLLGILNFIIGVPLSNFVDVSFLLMYLQNNYF